MIFTSVAQILSGPSRRSKPGVFDPFCRVSYCRREAAYEGGGGSVKSGWGRSRLVQTGGGFNALQAAASPNRFSHSGRRSGGILSAAIYWNLCRFMLLPDGFDRCNYQLSTGTLGFALGLGFDGHPVK